ncbi:MAG: glycyl-radical enzyme activating protein, partial [Rhodospirillaceae bacterium]|nr:glycyl-radical enzyme activating protein [Rhodospirillaceae bacterium]
LMGHSQTIYDIFDQVMADEIFYQQSGGGITVSGGEPLAQPDLVADLLERCQKAGLHTTLDTSGYAGWAAIEQVMRHVDLVLYDFKHMDPEAHQRLTGVSNELILENAKRIYHELAVPIKARVSVVPGFNDTAENISAMAKFVAEELDPSVEVHLLPYHRLGEAKREQLEQPDGALDITPPEQAHLLDLQKIVEASGLIVHIGG